MSAIEIEISPTMPSADPRVLDATQLDALDRVLSIDALKQLGHFAHRLRTTDELIAQLEYEAVRGTRAMASPRCIATTSTANATAQRSALGEALRTLFALVEERTRR